MACELAHLFFTNLIVAFVYCVESISTMTMLRVGRSKLSNWSCGTREIANIGSACGTQGISAANKSNKALPPSERQSFSSTTTSTS